MADAAAERSIAYLWTKHREEGRMRGRTLPVSLFHRQRLLSEIPIREIGYAGIEPHIVSTGVRYGDDRLPKCSGVIVLKRLYRRAQGEIVPGGRRRFDTIHFQTDTEPATSLAKDRAQGIVAELHHLVVFRSGERKRGGAAGHDRHRYFCRGRGREYLGVDRGSEHAP